MVWKKRDECSTIEEVIKRNTRLETLDYESQTNIRYLENAAERIIEAVNNNETITIFGDYDADGVTASSILWATIMTLRPEKPAVVRLPRRFSEGYGISLKACNEFNEGLVITVDNGISAIEPIKALKEKGISVVVVDHHLAKEELPDADIIVNPHVYKYNDDDFEDFCGAGLAYRICDYIIEKMVDDEKKSSQMRSYFLQLAAIGTVCDVMPLIKDNRNIVIKGLASINDKPCRGLAAILEATETYSVDETTCGFLIGPIINACGRMKDDGAIMAFDVLTSCKRIGTEKLKNTVAELVSLNDKRKDDVATAIKSANSVIYRDCLFGNYPLVIVDESISEGIVGIIAGKIAEQYKVPTIVLTMAENGNYKGSARSYGGVNIKEMFDAASGYLIAYGGHEGAGGLTVSPENIDLMYTAMNNYIGEYTVEENDTVYYDLEIEEKDIANALETVKKYAPYGEGNPRILFRVKNFVLSPRLGQFSKIMGEENEHIKLFGKGFSAIGFGLVSKYDENLSKKCSCIGSLSENNFRGTIEAQIEMIDFVHENTAEKSELAKLLSEKLKSL